jgi:hypothetical protein
MQGEPKAAPRGGGSLFASLGSSLLGPVPPPRLAPGERLVIETALGRGDTAVLTDRRVLVVGRNFERSLPLAHLALAHVRFERIAGEIIAGLIAILVAALLFAVASPVRAFFLGQATALEAAAAQERAAAAANPSEGEGPALPGQGQGLAQGLQKLMHAFAAAARALPALGWLLLAAAAAKIALGIRGRTVVAFTAGGSELTFARRGRDRLLREFITEVGGHLPEPARPGVPLTPGAAAPGPALPPNGPGRA